MTAPTSTRSGLDAEALRRYRAALEEVGAVATDICSILRELSADDGPVGRLLEREIRHIGALCDVALTPEERPTIAARWMLPQSTDEASV